MLEALGPSNGTSIDLGIWKSAKVKVGVRFWRTTPRLFSSREMKSTCVTKEKHAIPWRIPYSYLNRMKIFCELPARVLMLMTLLFHCLHTRQEGRVLLWKDQDKQDQASCWLGWGWEVGKEWRGWDRNKSTETSEGCRVEVKAGLWIKPDLAVSLGV